MASHNPLVPYNKGILVKTDLPEIAGEFLIDTDASGELVIRNPDGSLALLGEGAHAAIIRDSIRRGVKIKGITEKMVQHDPNALLATKEGEWRPKDGQTVHLDDKGNVDPSSIHITPNRELARPGHQHYMHPEFKLVPVNPEDELPLAIDTNKSDQELMTGKSMQTINGELVEETGIPVAYIGICPKCGVTHDHYQGCDARGALTARFPRHRFSFPANPYNDSFGVIMDGFVIPGVEWRLTKVSQNQTLAEMVAAVEGAIKAKSLDIDEDARARALSKLSPEERRALGL